MKEITGNPMAEMAVLGAALLKEKYALRVVSDLDEDDFFTTSHRLIFTAMKQLFDAREKIKPQSVAELLMNQNQLELIGGEAALIALAKQVTFVEDTEDNIRIIKNKSLLRQLVRSCEKIIDESNDIVHVGEYLSQAEDAILNVTRMRRVSSFLTMKEIGEKIKTKIKDRAASSGVKSGFVDLDAITNGFQKSDMVIVAARPSTGKTALALNFAINAARENFKIAIFSLEMAAEKLAERMLSAISGVTMNKLRTYQFLSEADRRALLSAIEEISGYDIFIDDASSSTMSEIATKARKIDGLDMIILDYIGLIQSKGKVESRQMEIADYSKSLKALARELNIPALILSQVSRESEKRKGDNEPKLSDIRDSGAIEQDADVVLMLSRPSDKSGTGEENIINVKIAKHRNGATGDIQLVFCKENQLFRSKQR